MFKKLLFGLGALLCSPTFLYAQHRNCATMDHLELLEQQYPGTKAKLEKVNQTVQKWEASHAQVNQKTATTVLTIPVVVHVVYRTATQNISDAQVFSQITALNNDYSKLNPDTANIPAAFKPLLGNMQIQFVLAKRDPNGDPTTGITRTLTTKTSFGLDDAMKYTSRGGHDAWDRDKYLNLWVCNLGGGLLGYAQFPGSGPAGSDGVAIGYNYFGTVGAVSSPFNKGRTATHEVGHWLNLYHIWGDDAGCVYDDLVADTPMQKEENYGCPTFPQGSSQTGGSCSGSSPGSMFMNYMDYVDDACMFMFTKGQVMRAMAALQTIRPTLFTSDGAVPVTVQGLDASIFAISSPKGTSCNTQFIPKVTLKNKGTATLTSATITYSVDGGTAQSYQWTGSLATFATTVITLPAKTVVAGNHTFTATTSLPNNQTDNDITNDSKTVSFVVNTQTPGLTLPLSEGFETTVFPPAGWTRTNPDGDITWARTSNAAKQGNFSAYLNNYDYTYVGEVDELILPTLNLTSASSPVLTFQLAYTPTGFTTGFADTLNILASTDCGVTFSSIYKKFGQTLATATPTGNVFTPTASQWRLETVNLGALAANNSVILKFKHTTGYENNLYIDDVKVASVLGVKETATNNARFTLFPNPANGLVTATIKGFSGENATILVTNALGQEILRKNFQAANDNITFDLSGNSAGIYLVQFVSGEKTFTQKLILTK